LPVAPQFVHLRCLMVVSMQLPRFASQVLGRGAQADARCPWWRRAGT
jgi:hypothetical protein